MPKIWTWLVMVLATASAVVLADWYSGPQRASAQDAGEVLSEPVYPPRPVDRGGSVRNRVGWTASFDRLGRDMPVGKGVAVGQVEFFFRGGYYANTYDEELKSVGFIPESGPAVSSTHATMVAGFAFGRDSAAPGVREVHAWRIDHWLRDGMLNTGTTDPPIGDHPARVFNHAWVGSGAPTDPLVLRRVDFQADVHDVLHVVGVGNEPGPIPSLLASAYNVISVGLMNGQSSDGLTKVEGDGRSKPELVAPAGKTSFATGIVTGVAAALIEYADRKAEQDAGLYKDVQRSEVIKALLLGGAFRTNKWAPPEGEALDRALGAGMVDLDRALVMLEGGHAEPDQAAPIGQRYGYSFAQIKPGQSRDYRFVIDAPQREVGIALTWHRRVAGGTAVLRNNKTGEERAVWNSTAFCPDLDLVLMKLDPQNNEEQVALSTTKAGNIELIDTRQLKPGRYVLRVARVQDDFEGAWDYALAWRIEAPGFAGLVDDEEEPDE